MKKIIFIIIVFIINQISFAQWEMTNGPGSSYVPCILIDNNDIFVASGSGIFRTTNVGETWDIINNKVIMDFYIISGIVKKDNTIFAGSIYGVFKTDDLGNHWEMINDGFKKNAHYVRKMLQIGDDIFALTGYKLYLYNDKEKKWVMPYDSLIQGYFGSFSAINNKDNNIYLGKKIDFMSNPPEPNIFISDDKGKSWRGITDTISGIAKCNISCFAFKDTLIFAGTNDGVYISSDNGENWTEKSEGIIWGDITDIHVVGDLVFTGTSSGLYYSTDNGESWILRQSGLKNGYVLSIKSYDDKIFVGSAGGLFISTDYGERWNSISTGLSGGFVWDITEEYGRLYAGMYEKGIYFSDDGGDYWAVLSKLYKNYSIYKIAVQDSNIYAGLYMPGGLLFSNDSGNNWKRAVDTNGLKNQRVDCFEFDGNKIYTGTWQGVYYSEDNGISWKSAYTNLENRRVTSLKISGDNILAGTYQYGIYVSTDKGVTWNNSSTSFTKLSVRDFIINENKIFAGTYNSNEEDWKGVFLSTDWGITWNQVNNGLPENGINCLASYGDNIFAGTDNEGVYLSKNNGELWKNVSLGLTNYSIKKLLVINNEIFAATTAGVYKANIGDFGITNVIDEQTELKNYLWAYKPYPIPAINYVNTQIFWDTSLDIENDEINIYDFYGNKVANKKDITIDKITSYSGLLKWNCSAFSSGIYLIHIQHGTRVWTIKVMVNK
ncbi:T9SS type A sorting domain-containing protein [Bacteroidota bacterium]